MRVSTLIQQLQALFFKNNKSEKKKKKKKKKICPYML